MIFAHKFAVSAQLSIAATALAVLASASTGSAVFVAEPAADRTPSLAPTDAWDTFSAEVTIRRHLTVNGTRSAEAPAVRYRWTRSARPGGWKSTVEIAGLAAPTIRSSAGDTRRVLLDAPPSRVRIEDDEDGTPLRVYNERGEAMRLPGVEDRRVLGEPVPGSLHVPALPELAYPDAKRPAASGREWVDAFIASANRREVRRNALQRRFGRAAGRLKHLDRFLTADGQQTVEVLADRTSAVPIEINLARDGVLVTQSRLAYGPGAGGALVRRSVRTEHLVSSRSTERMVANVDLSNVRLERRGVR